MRQQQHHLSVFEIARAGIVKTRALMFFASALLQTKCVEDPACDTAWTDMTVIGYNPSFIESLDVPTAKFVIAHELMHMLLKHGLRRGDRDPVLWNGASDYAINIMLHDLGFKVWKHALFDVRYRNMSAEQIYASWRQPRGRPGQPQQGLPSSLTGGPPQLNDKQSGLGGDLRPVPATTFEKKAQIEHEIGKVLARAAATAREMGVMPGNLETIVGAAFEEPVPWERVLMEYLSARLAHEENWSRRNRRHPEIILPSYKSNSMGELTIVADSSGSMFSKSVFERIAAAVNYIVTAVKPMVVRVVWADDKDQRHTDVFEQGDEVILHPKGGGGTDMRKPLAYVAEQYSPEVVLLLTDGYTPYPETPPPFPLIIGCTTNAPCPDYAGVVRIEVS